MVPLPELHYVWFPGGSDRNMYELLLFLPLSHCGAMVFIHQCLPRDEHNILTTQLMRDRALIQDENGVLHIPVHKIHLEVRDIGGPP